MEYSKLVCILMFFSCGILCVSSSFDADLGDYLTKMASGESSFTCMEKIMPCQPYLVPGPNPPPPNCCTPLKELLINDTKCICDTFNNPLVMGSLNVTMDDVMKLPAACNETFDINVCKSGNLTGGAGDHKSSDTNSSTPSTVTLNSDSTADLDSDSDSTTDSNSDSTPDADLKASGAYGKFSSSSGREHILFVAFFVAFIVSVY